MTVVKFLYTTAQKDGYTPSEPLSGLPIQLGIGDVYIISLFSQLLDVVPERLELEVGLINQC